MVVRPTQYSYNLSSIPYVPICPSYFDFFFSLKKILIRKTNRNRESTKIEINISSFDLQIKTYFTSPKQF